MFDLRSALAIPAVYELFSKVVGGRLPHVYVNQHVKPEAGMRVLDVGCGPNGFLKHLADDVEYVGIDISEEYIASARAKWGHRGEFHCESVEDTVVRDPGTFDLVLANGLIHHLDDSTATRLLDIASRALKPSGRMVTLDGCFTDQQSWAARAMLRRDRGEYVRHEKAYVELARGAFPDVEATIYHGLIRIPYTHIVMECRKVPAEARRAA